MTTQERAELNAQIAKGELESSREYTASELQRVAEMMLNYAERISAKAKEIAAGHNDGDHGVRGSDRAEWAINDIENFVRNINFSTLARHSGRLKAAEQQVKMYENAKPEAK